MRLDFALILDADYFDDYAGRCLDASSREASMSRHALLSPIDTLVEWFQARMFAVIGRVDARNTIFGDFHAFFCHAPLRDRFYASHALQRHWRLLRS